MIFVRSGSLFDLLGDLCVLLIEHSPRRLNLVVVSRLRLLTKIILNLISI